MHALPLTATLLQGSLGLSDSQGRWLIAFTGITAFALLAQAVIIIVLAVVVTRLVGHVTRLSDELKPKVFPIIDHARDLVTDTVPKIKRVTTNIAETSDVYRAKVAQVDALLTDTAQKAKRQSDRVDSMVSDTLTSAGHVVGHIQNAVMAPVRQVTHVFQLLRNNVERLTQKGSEAARQFSDRASAARARRSARPSAFEGESVYTGLEDDYHA